MILIFQIRQNIHWQVLLEYSLNEILGCWMLRLTKDLQGRTGFNHITFFHDSHIITYGLNDIHFMGDHNNGNALFLINAFQQLQYRFGGLRI